MEQTWRWFGPADKVTLQDARQAGAEGIVTALHQLPQGVVWPIDLIRERIAEVEAAGLRWSVVESLDVSERIKTRAPGYQDDIESFKQSLRNLAACGLGTVAYNLMPVFSWMRTHLQYPVANGGSAVAFDATAFAAFDLYILARPNAEADWPEDRCRAAHAYLQSLSQGEKDALQSTILQGLPGGNGAFTLAQVRTALEAYKDIDDNAFRQIAGDFLRAVAPVAEEAGIRLSIHPDDPPRPLLGLPRIVSTESDLAYLLAQYPSPANALTFCTGALGVRPDNNLQAMVERFAPNIGFAHLRSTQREPDNFTRESPKTDAQTESFFEAEHLAGDTDLIAIVGTLVKEERRRQSLGDPHPIPFRPDHGQQLLNDHDRHAQPGYPAIGRLRGLAELRGVILTTQRLQPA